MSKIVKSWGEHYRGWDWQYMVVFKMPRNKELALSVESLKFISLGIWGYPQTLSINLLVFGFRIIFHDRPKK
jgi:hypothetical protein